MQWDEMKPRERDALVTEKVMEWRKSYAMPGSAIWSWYLPDNTYAVCDRHPHYTTDHNAAAEVRAEIARRRLHGDFLGHLGSILEVAIPVAKGIGLKSLWELTNATPEQQCRAALRAVGVEV